MVTVIYPNLGWRRQQENSSGTILGERYDSLAGTAAEPVSCDDVGSLARRLSPPLHGHHSVSVPWPANVQLRAAGTLSQAYSWRNELALVGRFQPRNARRPAHIWSGADMEVGRQIA